MTVFKFALLRGLRQKLSIAINCALPIALILIRPLWESGTDETNGFTLLAMAIMYGSFLMARGLLSDKLDGTVIRILAGPITSLRYLAQNLLACMVPLFIQIIVVCALGMVRYDWELSLSLNLMLCYTLFAASSVAFSLAWSCLFKDKETSFSVFIVIMSLVGIISGFWIPLSLLPDTVRYIGMLFPAHWVSSSIVTLLESGTTVGYWLSLLAMLLFTVAYLLYGGKRRIV